MKVHEEGDPMTAVVDEIVFKPWPKIPRLNRGMIITEKIDGTNAAVIVTENGQVGAQSRNRIITPDDDNFGFAAWVQQNATVLADTLGPGHYYGEWWGAGIQRGYGLSEKRFSLFNTSRWSEDDVRAIPQLGVVPVLAAENFNHDVILDCVHDLLTYGSVASPGFMRPEGVVVYLSAARQMFKVMCENDDMPKGESV